jgi:hypothetical protein
LVAVLAASAFSSLSASASISPAVLISISIMSQAS